MLRLNLRLVAVALAAGTFGCAQCDTCDDFPVPCAGGACGSPAMAPVVYGGGPGPMPAPMGSAEYMLPPGAVVPPATLSPAPAAAPTAPAGGTAAPATSTSPAPIPLTSVTPPRPMSLGSPTPTVR